MSKLNQDRNSGVHAGIATSISTLIAEQAAVIQNPTLGGNAIGLEGLNDSAMADLSSSYDSLRGELEAGALGSFLEGLDDNVKDVSLEAAALSILSSGDIAGHIEALTSNAQAPQGGVLAAVSTNHQDYGTFESFGIEGYDEASAQKYTAFAAYATSLAAVQGDFEETFFPTYVVPVGSDGVDIPVNIPLIYGATGRSANGDVTDFAKVSVIKGLIDSSILDDKMLAIVPNAIAGNANHLAVAAEVPNTIESINGVDVPTRALAMGVTTDLISVSAVTALLSGGVMDKSDTLDATISIGKVFVKLVHGVLEAVVAVDLSSVSGAQFTATATGSTRDYQVNFNESVSFARNAVSISGDMDAVTAAAGVDLGVAPADVTELVIALRLSGLVNIETANAVLDSNSPALVGARDETGLAIANGVVTAAAGNLDVSVVGWLPAASRSNNNMRTTGYVVDSKSTVVYRLPVMLGTPISTAAPVGSAMNTTLAGLAQVQRVRNNMNAVKALLGVEAMLSSGSGIPENNPAVGAHFITPKLVTGLVDVPTVTVTLASTDAMVALRGSLTTAMHNCISKLVQETGYIAALQFMTGKTSGYEAIVVTDERIASFLMESGEERTVGPMAGLKITQTTNAAVKGKIYMSLRLKDSGGKVNPLNFGTHLLKPSITMDATVSRNGGISKEVITMPCSTHAVMLPALAVITVTGMDDYYIALD